MSRILLAIRAALAVIVLAASLSAPPTYAQVGATVRVDPAMQTVQVNTTANITIRIDNVADLTAFEIHLSFNPGALEVTGITNGGFVAADFVAQNTFDNGTGTIDYAIAQMNRPPAQGSGTLLNIAFRAKAAGSSTVTTRSTPAAPDGLLLADQNGMAISATWTPGTIHVGSSTPVGSTPTNTSTPLPITNTPTNTSTPVTNTNTPGMSLTPTPTTNIPTQTSTPFAHTPTNTPAAGLCPSPVPQGMATVRFDPSTSSIRVDNVPKPPGLAGFEIHLSFNPALLEITSLANGGFIVADFVAQNTFDNNAGTIDYAVSQGNRVPAGGSGTLLKIAFRARATGNSTVTTRPTPAAPSGLILSDPNGRLIPACWLPGTINGGPGNGMSGTHVVRWGEWIYCIARAYRVSPSAIIQANRLWWPYIVIPNQRLTIPNIPWTNMIAGPVCQAQFTFPAPTPTRTATPATPVVTNTPPSVTPIPATTAPPQTCRATYIVRRGDTLYRIALRYGTTYMEIARVNQIPNPRLIYPGQQLCIP